MQQQFYIKSTGENVGRQHNFGLQIGTDYIGYVIHNTVVNEVVELGWYGKKETQIGITELFEANSHLKQKFQSVLVCIDNNENLLVPSSHINNDFTSSFYINAINQQNAVIHENIDGLQITNLYSIHPALLSSVYDVFPDVKMTHLKSLLIKNISWASDFGALDVNVANSHITIIASKENQLLLAQNYPYTSPADVLFYLLKICKTHSLLQDSVQVYLSGMIDKESGLFNELYQYFLHISFKEASWTLPEGNVTYPAHIFTTLNQLSLCESLQEI